MNLIGRVQRLEGRQETGAPAAHAVWYPVEGGYRVEVRINATDERMPLAEYEARWPHHPTLKAYLGEADGTCFLDDLCPVRPGSGRWGASS